MPADGEAVPAAPRPVASAVGVPGSSSAPSTPAPINPTSAPSGMSTGVVTAGVVGVNEPAGHTGPAPDALPLAAVPADEAAAAGVAALAAPGPGPVTATPGPGAPPTAPPAASPQPALQPQLAKPLFTLAGAPHGQHIMTLKVSPEDLGPLTVRAHIDGAGVRIELFAPGDTGREALRGILPELRKELADAGFGASLDVSDHSGPAGGGQETGRDAAGRDASPTGNGSGTGSGGRNGRDGPGDPRPGHRWDALADASALRTARRLDGPHTTLDILV